LLCASVGDDDYTITAIATIKYWGISTASTTATAT
jgi:hypothetical protein